MTTNGRKAMPSREQIIMTATYYAAISGYYDTSEAAQKSSLLTVSVMDMANVPGEPLPAGATHQFYVCIDATAYYVTRYQDDQYRVEAHDQTEPQRQERELRETVLDCALWYMTGEGAGYRPNQGQEARAAAMKELLEEGTGEERQEREASDPKPHPVIRDVLPDLYLALGHDGSRPPRVLRQWSVQIGPPSNYCEVGLIGYNPDGTPELIAIDGDQSEEEPDNEEE